MPGYRNTAADMYNASLLGLHYDASRPAEEQQDVLAAIDLAHQGTFNYGGGLAQLANGQTIATPALDDDAQRAWDQAASMGGGMNWAGNPNAAMHYSTGPAQWMGVQANPFAPSPAGWGPTGWNQTLATPWEPDPTGVDIDGPGPGVQQGMGYGLPPGATPPAQSGGGTTSSPGSQGTGASIPPGSQPQAPGGFGTAPPVQPPSSSGTSNNTTTAGSPTSGNTTTAGSPTGGSTPSRPSSTDNPDLGGYIGAPPQGTQPGPASSGGNGSTLGNVLGAVIGTAFPPPPSMADGLAAHNAQVAMQNQLAGGLSGLAASPSPESGGVNVPPGTPFGMMTSDPYSSPLAQHSGRQLSNRRGNAGGPRVATMKGGLQGLQGIG